MLTSPTNSSLSHIALAGDQENIPYPGSPPLNPKRLLSSMSASRGAQSFSFSPGNYGLEPRRLACDYGEEQKGSEQKDCGLHWPSKLQASTLPRAPNRASHEASAQPVAPYSRGSDSRYHPYDRRSVSATPDPSSDSDDPSISSTTSSQTLGSQEKWATYSQGQCSHLDLSSAFSSLSLREKGSSNLYSPGVDSMPALRRHATFIGPDRPHVIPCMRVPPPDQCNTVRSTRRSFSSTAHEAFAEVQGDIIARPASPGPLLFAPVAYQFPEKMHRKDSPEPWKSFVNRIAGPPQILYDSSRTSRTYDECPQIRSIPTLPAPIGSEREARRRLPDMIRPEASQGSQYISRTVFGGGAVGVAPSLDKNSGRADPECEDEQIESVDAIAEPRASRVPLGYVGSPLNPRGRALSPSVPDSCLNFIWKWNRSSHARPAIRAKNRVMCDSRLCGPRDREGNPTGELCPDCKHQTVHKGLLLSRHSRQAAWILSMEQGTDIQGGYTGGSALTSSFAQEAVLQSMEGSTEESSSISQLSNDVAPNPDVEGSRDDEHSR